jgi:hypothetical protein
LLTGSFKSALGISTKDDVMARNQDLKNRAIFFHFRALEMVWPPVAQTTGSTTTTNFRNLEIFLHVALIISRAEGPVP